MEEVLLDLNEAQQGHFYIADSNGLIAEMKVDISGKDLRVYHTEVSKGHEGKGLAKKLFLAMTDYAKKNDLKVTAFCPYVYAQFKRHQEEYADIWKNSVTGRAI